MQIRRYAAAILKLRAFFWIHFWIIRNMELPFYVLSCKNGNALWFVGFRYELYCVVKAAKTTQCVIYLNSTLDQSLSLNKTSNLYSEETIRALYLRFEAPQPKARWDSPLYEVYPESIDELSLDSIKQSLTSGNVLPPNMSTQNPPRMGAETLYDLDKLTQKLCAQVHLMISCFQEFSIEMIRKLSSAWRYSRMNFLVFL